MEGHHSFVSTLIFTSINFAIYIFLIYKFLFPKMKKFLEQKSEAMLSELQRSKSELESAKRKYDEAKLKREKANEEIKRIEEDINKLAEAESEKIIKSAQEFEKKKIEETENIIKTKVEDAKKEIRKHTLEYALRLAEEYIRLKKSDQDSKKFFSKILNSIDQIGKESKN